MAQPVIFAPVGTSIQVVILEQVDSCRHGAGRVFQGELAKDFMSLGVVVAKGAAIGAGAGLDVAAITRGERISVPAGTVIEFRLSRSLTQ